MLKKKNYVFWFVAGSQGLYGADVLSKVEANAKSIVNQLNQKGNLLFEVKFQAVVTTADAISRMAMDANNAEDCGGIITWMHTFSPAKMWINGLQLLKKPLLHFHTQFNVEIPWDTIDMDFMNLNQAAHGDREFGFIGARLGLARKIIAGHWSDITTQSRIADWMNTAAATTECSNMKIARFGDNMRYVAVTEGDKVEAHIRFGWAVNGYPTGDLGKIVDEVSESQINELMDEYSELYDFTVNCQSDGPARDAVREQARIEIGMKTFLEAGGYSAVVTSFEDLHGIKQLPGLAAQRLMAAGYGFGAEGDWKTAGLVRLMKLMAKNKATSFMEDYTYHMEPGNEKVLGSHMLEICPTLASERAKIEVYPLFVGGKNDPARLVFDGVTGRGINATIVDMGSRFRLIVNEVTAVANDQKMPNLPVARLMWNPEPSLTQAAEAWITAGGAHHFGFSLNVTADQLSDWAKMVGIECVVINSETTVATLEEKLRWNDLYYKLK